MHPTLQPGDELEIVPVTGAELQVGQVVAVCRGDRNVVAHRLVGICPPHIITVGDNSLLLDIPALMDRVLGVVVAGRREGQPFAIRTEIPFPTVPDKAKRAPGIELVGPGTSLAEADFPGMVRLPLAELEALLAARKRAGIPILAVCDNGRGSSGTLAYYLNTYERVVLAFGVLAGYGHSMQFEVDDSLIAEAVRISDVTALFDSAVTA